VYTKILTRSDLEQWANGGACKSAQIHQEANVRSGQIRLTESAGLECYMSEAALALTGDETASPNSGESRWPGFGVHDGPENAQSSGRGVDTS